MVGAGATLWQNAHWRALFGGFPPLAQGLHYGTVPMEKGLFLGFFTRRCLQGKTKLMFRGMQCKCLEAMSVLLGPRMSPPRCGRGVTRTVTNCYVTDAPWHEAKKGGVKCFTRTCPTENTAAGKPAWRSTTDISNTWYMWYGRSHP